MLKQLGFLKSKSWWALSLAVIFSLTASVIFLYSFWRSRPVQLSGSTSESAEPTTVTVTALGRLEPEGEVIFLSPSPTLEGARLAELLVQEGDQVKLGQLVAVLDRRERLQATLEEAREQLKVARSRLDQVKAGAKVGEIEAQKATIARLKAELGNAEAEYERHQSLYQEGAISASLFDSKRLKWQTTQERVREAQMTLEQIITTGQEEIREAQATLERIAEVRPVDVAVARSEVDRFIASVKKAEADLELAYVYSPVDGQILQLNAQPGEIVGERGIAEIGQTEKMYVVAEVYETDINKVQLGQQARIISEYGGFSGELQGTVAQIGWQISKKAVLELDASAQVDVRVVEVKIKLTPEDSDRVKNLTNLRVQVSIQIENWDI